MALQKDTEAAEQRLQLSRVIVGQTVEQTAIPEECTSAAGTARAIIAHLCAVQRRTALQQTHILGQI